jgi:hypothetical protein
MFPYRRIDTAPKRGKTRSYQQGDNLRSFIRREFLDYPHQVVAPCKLHRLYR